VGGDIVKRRGTTSHVPRDFDHDKRAIALARRLGIDLPEQPLTAKQWVTLWASIGKALLPIEEPRTLEILWADIGQYLAERDQPEFLWGPGRRPGSRSRRLSQSVTPAAIRKRRQRAKKIASMTLTDLVRRDKN
jgi:hypothetical protein